MLNKSSESEHCCLDPDLKEKSFIFSPLSMTLAHIWVYHILAFIKLSLVSYIPFRRKFFILNEFWILLNALLYLCYGHVFNATFCLIGVS